MNKIPASRLADLLNEGFGGEARFSGRAFAWMSSVEFGPFGNNFYRAEGDFVISSLDGLRRAYCLRNVNDSKGTNFMFKLREDERVKHSHPERYRDIISVPIEMGSEVCLQIEPRDIIY